MLCSSGTRAWGWSCPLTGLRGPGDGLVVRGAGLCSVVMKRKERLGVGVGVEEDLRMTLCGEHLAHTTYWLWVDGCCAGRVFQDRTGGKIVGVWLGGVW